jgi:hypothetical protein
LARAATNRSSCRSKSALDMGSATATCTTGSVCTSGLQRLDPATPTYPVLQVHAALDVLPSGDEECDGHGKQLPRRQKIWKVSILQLYGTHTLGY